MTWKTPHNYPLAQVDFCDCEAGGRATFYWEGRWAERERQRLATLFSLAGVPAKYRDVTLESSMAACLADPAKTAAYHAAVEFTENGCVDSRGQLRGSLMYSGPYGCGKTHLLTAVFNHFLAQGRASMWIEFYDFTGEVQAGYGNGQSEDRVVAAMETDVLLLDDLGKAERNHPVYGFAETDDKIGILRRVINARYNDNKTTLISTNLSPEQIAQQFDGRTMDRLKEMCGIYGVAGRNLRV